ncbi:uncharacterized protein [Parasteatoda tepidariorum]|uniref:uncharacterized protein n=1 Tax=Parasteatoda tepidariorum TaxID=114398 RepID=UPI0039BD5081
MVNRPEAKDFPDDFYLPKFNFLGSSTTQLVIHSPYLSASPYTDGQSFLGGKKYKVRVRKNEKHLLPPPYQTNCTDYVSLWKQRGGYGPLNQMMAIEECKFNQSIEELGCVPFTVDYPHNDTVCRYCKDCLNQTRIGKNCTDLLRTYNQPCENIQYSMNTEEKIVYSVFETKTRTMRRPTVRIYLHLHEIIYH